MPDLSDLASVFDRFGASIIGGLVALFGLASLARIVAITRSLRSWESTDGVVHRAELVFEQGGHSDSTGTYVPKVRYEFEVNGRRYVGTRLSPTGDVSTSIRSQMEEKIAGLEVGGVVPVYYDPCDPGRCALTLQADGIMFSGLMVVGGAALALMAWLLGR